MGRKNKGGRRQILQLKEKTPPPVKTSKSKLKRSLIHHNESDEDSKKSSDTEFFSTNVPTKDPANPLDSQIADFFKEIDALSVPDELVTPQTDCLLRADLLTPKTEEKQSPSLENETSVLDGIVAHGSELLEPEDCKEKPTEKQYEVCSWQAIQDDSTGYSYYWNVTTNEVTWDCPPEYAAYMKAACSALVEKTPLRKNKRKKEPVEQPVGTIVPISCFTRDSSSDPSSEEEKTHSQSPKRPKFTPFPLKKKKGKPRKKSSSTNLPIGPQLPPDFQFTQDITGGNVSTNGLSSTDQLALGRKSESANQIASDSGSKPVVSLLGLRSVVAYDSFTDEEADEEESAAILVTKEVAASEERQPVSVKKDSVIVQAPASVGSKPKLLKPETAPKKWIKEKTQEDTYKLFVTNSEKNEQASKKWNKERTHVDIDKLFVANSYNCGFGWLKQQEGEECPKQQLEFKPHKKPNDSKPISFVKSADLLQLSAVPIKPGDLERETSRDLLQKSCDTHPFPVVKKSEVPEMLLEEPCDTPLLPVLSEECVLILPAVTKPNAVEDHESIEAPVVISKEASIVDVDSSDALASDMVLETDKQQTSPDSQLSPDVKEDNFLESAPVLFDKLAFLIINHPTMSKLSSYFIQLHTRFLDWQADALSSSYFVERLREADCLFELYESYVCSNKWKCQWNKEEKKYIFMNSQKQPSEDLFPDEECEEKFSTWVQSLPVVQLPAIPPSASTYSLVCEEPTEKPSSSDFSFEPQDELIELASITRVRYTTTPPPPGVDYPLALPMEFPQPPPLPLPMELPQPPPLPLPMELPQPPPLPLPMELPQPPPLPLQPECLPPPPPPEAPPSPPPPPPEASQYLSLQPPFETSMAQSELLLPEPSIALSQSPPTKSSLLPSQETSILLPQLQVPETPLSPSPVPQTETHSSKLLPLSELLSPETSLSPSLLRSTEMPISISSVLPQHEKTVLLPSTFLPPLSLEKQPEVPLPQEVTPLLNVPPIKSTRVNHSEPEDMDIEDSSSDSTPCPVFHREKVPFENELELGATPFAKDVDSGQSHAVNLTPEESLQSLEEKSNDRDILKTNKGKKVIKKKKTKLQLGLALKKKNITSLVEKWQKIKEEQEKEDS